MKWPADEIFTLAHSRKTHSCYNPYLMRVFDHHGNPIMPVDWERLLRHATAIVHFTVKKSVGPESDDIFEFVADIKTIRVVMPRQRATEARRGVSICVPRVRKK
jgi:hypothetical protein